MENKKIDFSKNCKIDCGFNADFMKQLLNWYSCGTYEDYKPLFNASGIKIGNENSLYCLSKIGNAVFEIKLNKAGLITEVIYFCDFNKTEQTEAAKTKLFCGKFSFNF